jgi:hypothetical protein
MENMCYAIINHLRLWLFSAATRYNHKEGGVFMSIENPFEEINKLVNQAIAEVANLQPGEKVMVRDLFLGYTWNRLSNYIRAQVGYGFYHLYANNEAISQVKILEKSARNQQLYMKN